MNSSLTYLVNLISYRRDSIVFDCLLDFSLGSRMADWFQGWPAMVRRRWQGAGGSGRSLVCKIAARMRRVLDSRDQQTKTDTRTRPGSVCRPEGWGYGTETENWPMLRLGWRQGLGRQKTPKATQNQKPMKRKLNKFNFHNHKSSHFWTR